MDDQIVKLLQSESKLNENDVNEDLIKKYKNNQLNKHLYNNMYYIKIPNNEIFNCFIAKLKESLKNEIKDNNYLNNFINGLFNKDIDTINSNLNDYLTCLSQYHLFANEKDYENVYQVLLMQIFIFCKIYGLNAEKNNGSGRYDFGFPNRNKKKEYILIEVKTCKSENCDDNLLHKECENAKNRIIEKKYKMKNEKNGYSSFIIYGITFWKRICRIEMKINNNDIKGPSESLKE